MNRELPQCLRFHLENLARDGKTISYRELAILAAVTKPQVILKVAEALEEIIREDHVAGIETSIASLAVSHANPAIPRAGFFMLLRELGLYNGPDEGTQAAIFHTDYIAKVFKRYS